ncbi:MAG: GTPase domain-containing protein [Desulfobacterales bacterium]|nr:GTPase domain-containing protein [Desulfobacterales bacterium]
MKLNRNPAEIKVISRIDGFKSDIDMLSSLLTGASLWRPATGLKKQCDAMLNWINELEERFDRKLVVTLIGPCGSGKSTLLNALAGVDDLSETGILRPTTQSLVVLSRDKNNIDSLVRHFGRENFEIKSSHAASSLENVLMIDTPDIDSTQQEEHIPMVKKAIEISDVLICLFDAENPKRRDYVDFMAPYVRMFNGESVFGIINKCDRMDERELKELIVPQFVSYIEAAWERSVNKVLCISGRRHLHHPKWDQKALPKHDFDQFEELRRMIFGTFNTPGYVVNTRLENAGSFRDYVFNESKIEVEKDKENLLIAGNHIKEMESTALSAALSELRRNESAHLLGINVMLYQKLAQQWLGPVGWLIAIWARILIFGFGIGAIFRFGNPIRQIWGIISSLRHFKESQAAVTDTKSGEKVDTALRNYRLSIKQDWPGVAEMLVKARFDHSVRKIEDILPNENILGIDLTDIWRESLNNTIEDASKRLSGFMLQILFNLPVVGILGHAGWITAHEYFRATYLSSGFFLHAFLTIVIILFLVFFIFQGCVRIFASNERITNLAFEMMKQRAEQYQSVSMNPVKDQISNILAIASLSQFSE